MMKEEYTCN